MIPFYILLAIVSLYFINLSPTLYIEICIITLINLQVGFWREILRSDFNNFINNSWISLYVLAIKLFEVRH